MNTKPNHTLLPWKFSVESGDPSWAIITTSNGSIIANVNSETGPDTTSAPTTRKMPAGANADFICRAVNSHDELIAALCGMLDSYAPAADVSAEKCGEGSLHSAVRQARAAIARAKGETTP